MALQNPLYGDGNDVYFAAALKPNRSLSINGFRLLMVLTAFLTFGIGTTFFILGAWPVMGFCGLEFILLYIAFRLNYRAGRAAERICLTEKELEVTRISPYGKAQQWRFEPTWLQVLIDTPPLHHSKLRLRSHGRSLVIGSFLTPEERLEVAEALRAALQSWRRR
ncbi:MAG: DUF2244 domain-containing protein [Proteobacteria bacterium]|nr:DUF2244 domain-containing protein [Pseudomonadota bacterium]